MIVVEGKIKAKAVKGYEGRYKILENGDVVRLIKGSRNKDGNKVLKHWLDKDGYHTVTLWKDRKPKQFRVHRLVAEAFIDNPNNLPQVNHLDGNKNNNAVTNLEWVTLERNIRHAFEIGIYKRGEERGNSKLTNDEVRWIRKNYIKGSRTVGAKPLARKFGVTETCIYYIVRNITYKEVI